MKVCIEYKKSGAQIRSYGPRQYDVVISIEPPPGVDEFHYKVFERWARKATDDWVKPGEGNFASWRLRSADKVDKNSWRFIVEQPYLD